MPRKSHKNSSFGKRLVALRKTAGITQVQLASLIGSSQRAISYYENEAGFPPAPVLAAIAKALNVSTDELMGLSRPSAKPKSQTQTQAQSPELLRLWKKFQLVLSLPEKDQRAIIRLINSLFSAKKKSTQ
jgi:transcriptional regulator with XRE-family HTH domain